MFREQHFFVTGGCEYREELDEKHQVEISGSPHRVLPVQVLCQLIEYLFCPRLLDVALASRGKVTSLNQVLRMVKNRNNKLFGPVFEQLVALGRFMLAQVWHIFPQHSCNGKVDLVSVGKQSLVAISSVSVVYHARRGQNA